MDQRALSAASKQTHFSLLCTRRVSVLCGNNKLSTLCTLPLDSAHSALLPTLSSCVCRSSRSGSQRNALQLYSSWPLERAPLQPGPGKHFLNRHFYVLTQPFSCSVPLCCLSCLCPVDTELLNCSLKWPFEGLFTNKVTLGSEGYRSSNHFQICLSSLGLLVRNKTKSGNSQNLSEAPWRFGQGLRSLLQIQESES